MNPEIKETLDKSLMPTSMATELKLFRAMLYGDFGQGKTTLAIEIIRRLGGRALLITTDSAWTVIQKEEFWDIRPQIDRLPYEGFSQIAAILDLREEGVEPYASYRNLVWDTVSTGVDGTMRKLVDGLVGPKYAKIREQQSHELVEGWPHYRITERALVDIVTRLRNTDLNIIYTAHVRDPSEADVKKGRMAIRPNMPQASYNVVAREVALIAWLHVELEKNGAKYLAQTLGTKTETGKSQIPTIPQAIMESKMIPELVAKWVNQ